MIEFTKTGENTELITNVEKPKYIMITKKK